VSAYLADACALIDFYTGEPTFPAPLRALFESHAPSIAVPATTAWEIAIKTALGKLVDIRDPEFGTLAEMLSAEGYVLLPSIMPRPNRPRACRSCTEIPSIARWWRPPSGPVARS
jgi:hypothetical protein